MTNTSILTHFVHMSVYKDVQIKHLQNTTHVGLVYWGIVNWTAITPPSPMPCPTRWSVTLWTLGFKANCRWMLICVDRSYFPPSGNPIQKGRKVCATKQMTMTTRREKSYNTYTSTGDKLDTLSAPLASHRQNRVCRKMPWFSGEILNIPLCFSECQLEWFFIWHA